MTSSDRLPGAQLHAHDAAARLRPQFASVAQRQSDESVGPVPEWREFIVNSYTTGKTIVRLLVCFTRKWRCFSAAMLRNRGRELERLPRLRVVPDPTWNREWDLLKKCIVGPSPFLLVVPAFSSPLAPLTSHFLVFLFLPFSFLLTFFKPKPNSRIFLFPR